MDICTRIWLVLLFLAMAATAAVLEDFAGVPRHLGVRGDLLFLLRDLMLVLSFPVMRAAIFPSRKHSACRPD